MSVIFDEACLDRWLEDFDAFRVDFLTVCHPICMALGFELDFDQRQLSVAHAAWRASHDLWKGHKVPDTTHVLSHVKICALLLAQLASVNWVRNLYEYAGDYHKFNGEPEARLAAADDLNAAREAFLGYHFVIQVICWYETHRTDKVDAFVYRMTPDLEFDLMHYLLSSEKSEVGLFLILKAVFLRD